MIGIDTNVLVRYLAQDDPKQAKLAARFLDQHCTSADPGHISLIVLCELLWLMRRGYHLDRAQAARIIAQLLDAPMFNVEQSHLVRLALEDFTAGNADLTDYLLGRLHQAAGAAYTVTFDRQAGQHPLFHLLRA